jgi:hypothetical protein
MKPTEPNQALEPTAIAVTLEGSRMIVGVCTSAGSPVGAWRAEAAGSSSGYQLSGASSRGGVCSRGEKKEKEAIGAGELKVLRPVAREVLFALVDAGRLRMSRTPYFPNQALETTRWTGAVVRGRQLRSTVGRGSKGRLCARQRVSHL